MVNRTGDLQLIQELNRSLVFETIRDVGPISRNNIAKKLGISASTVTSAVNELIKFGLVEEGFAGESSGGRKPILIRFSSNNRFIIGVSITNLVISIGILNLNLEVNHIEKYAIENRKGTTLVRYIIDLLRDFLRKTKNLDQCLGIAVAASGIVDYKQGTIRYNSTLKLNEVPLKQIVEQNFGIETFLENDTNILALLEKRLCNFNNTDNIIYIHVEDGIGAALILNGIIYRGSKGGAGELGHTTIEKRGVTCDCGNKGCLNRYASWPEILTTIKNNKSEYPNSSIFKMVNYDLNKTLPVQILSAWEEGDPLAKKIIDDVSSYLSFAVVNLINLFDPSIIVLNSKLLCENDRVFSNLKSLIFKRALETNTNDLNIYPSSTTGAESILIGAANVLLNEKFSFSLKR